MNKRRRSRAVLVLGTVGLLLTVACGLWLLSARRQEALNRQLIAALMKDEKAPLQHSGPYEHREAMALVNAGADPNTPVKSLPPPSLRQLWDCLTHRSLLPANHCTTAFLLACGGGPDDPNLAFSKAIEYHEDFAPLRQAMLQHGANVEAADENGYTGLIYAARTHNLKTLDLLLRHGVNVNGHRDGVDPPLFWAAFTSLIYPISYRDAGPPDSMIPTTFLRRLLAHGADPNLPDPYGRTALQLAQQARRSDLVALLKQAGAKK